MPFVEKQDYKSTMSDDSRPDRSADRSDRSDRSIQLFVGRLPIDTDIKEVEDRFNKYGQMTRCDLKRGIGIKLVLIFIVHNSFVYFQATEWVRTDTAEMPDALLTLDFSSLLAYAFVKFEDKHEAEVFNKFILP